MQLPVPDIQEIESQCHSFKDQTNGYDSDRRSRRPPKLFPKHHDISLNRSLNTSVAQAISFKNETINVPLSPMYRSDRCEPYFEQCFDIIEKIGEGSFGEVFKVRSREDGMLYAVKKSIQLYRSENYRAERLEEVRRYEELSEHEHCITMYRAWEQDDRLYMQLELCRCSLEKYVAQRGFLSESLVWRFFLDLLLALKALHDRNLIHLDIKLDNVLVTDDDVCKLGDFGLVINLNEPHLKHATEGDCRYIAPELMQGKFSKAADIFSLGITILELSTNLVLPQNGPLWQQLRNGVLPSEVLHLISTELQVTLTRMMDPISYRRPDVDNLLTIPLLQKILKQRHELSILDSFRKAQRSVRYYCWQKIIKLKLYIWTVITAICSLFKLKSIKTDCPSSDGSLLSLDDSEIECSPKNKLNISSTVPQISQIVNSTPLNTFGTFRNRRNAILKSQGFHSNDGVSMFESSNVTSQLNNSNSNSNSNVGQDLSLICKKLCFNPEDSD